MALTKLKMAVFAPMPRASVSTATAVKPGFFISWRKANLRSFITQRLHRIDPRRAPGGNHAGQQRDDNKQHHNADERERVGWSYTKELAGKKSRRGYCRG